MTARMSWREPGPLGGRPCGRFAWGIGPSQAMRWRGRRSGVTEVRARSVKGLRLVAERSLSVPAPFNFKTTVRKPSHFPTPLERFDGDGTYHVAAEVGGELYGVRLRLLRPELVQLSVYGDPGAGAGAPDHLTAELARRL